MSATTLDRERCYQASEPCMKHGNPFLAIEPTKDKQLSGPKRDRALGLPCPECHKGRAVEVVVNRKKVTTFAEFFAIVNNPPLEDPFPVRTFVKRWGDWLQIEPCGNSFGKALFWYEEIR